jgi:hypothetical protein
MGDYTMTTQRWPFGMNRAIAADFTGFAPATFDKLVREGRLPAPRHEGSRKVWLRDELEAALRALPSEREGSADETWSDVDAA